MARFSTIYRCLVSRLVCYVRHCPAISLVTTLGQLQVKSQCGIEPQTRYLSYIQQISKFMLKE